jgi:phenylacetate-CoA ligase
MLLNRMLWESYFALRRFRPGWQELDRHRLATPETARREMSRRLFDQLKYFGARGDALPEWREAAQVHTPEEAWKIWPELPVIGRTELQRRFHPQEIKDRFGVQGIVSRTGGSTGEPTPYLHDEAMLHVGTLCRAYCRLRLGWRPGMATICVWGSERDIGHASSLRGKISGLLRNDWMVGGYALNAETVDRVMHLLRVHRPVAMYGFTSMLEYVARESLRRGLNPPTGWVKAAWNGGEMLYPEQAEVFHRAFGTKLQNLYGSREFGAMAFEDAATGRMVPLRPFLFVEVVDENGRPAAPGVLGRLVWTHTVCRGTPFLRYDCGDVGCYAAEDLDESGIKALHQLHGRSAGLLKLDDGTSVSCLFWNHLFKDYAEIDQFQVAIRSNRSLEIRLKGKGLSPEREQHLAGTVRNMLGDWAVSFRWLDSMPLTPQGKLEQVIREK